MNKTPCLLLALPALHGEAPELRTVIPNSWRRITRLPPEEEAAFLRDNPRKG
ncbi:MAG: hypothetical protein LBQ35_07540 [Spirochaetaceae bacterium]|jgi:hypothetical protein|nr:hypothetical protein [Spirochaetaceae bacterium]